MLGGYIFVRNVVRNSALLYQRSLFVLHLFEKPCDEPLMWGNRLAASTLYPNKLFLCWCCRHLAPSTFALSRNPATLRTGYFRTGYFRGHWDFRSGSWIAVKKLKKKSKHTHTHTPLFLLYISNCVGISNVINDVKRTRGAITQNIFCPVHHLSPDGAISL